jgi:hypothetical protein
MYVVVKDEKLIDAFSHYTSDKQSVESAYPDCQVVETDLFFGESAILSVARFYQGKIVLKPTTVISLDKQFIKADGEDEIRILVRLMHCQPEEIISSVTLDIDGARIPVKLSGNQGAVRVSTRTSGLHIIRIEGDDFCKMEAGFEAA